MGLCHLHDWQDLCWYYQKEKYGKILKKRSPGTDDCGTLDSTLTKRRADFNPSGLAR